MAECYLCAAYIERGAGYRRAVQVETSVRVYFTRHGGGSYGERRALRTMCRRCATTEDRFAKGKWLRQICYVLASGLSIWFGWQTIIHGKGAAIWVGFIFLICLPVPIAAWIVEAICRKNAARHSADQVYAEVDAACAFRTGDTLEFWAHRSAEILRAAANSEPTFDERKFLKLAWYARPHVGEKFSDYYLRAMACWDAFDASRPNDCAPWRQNEPFADYAARAAPHLLSYVAGFSLDDIRPALVVLARSDPPRSDENLAEWIDRVFGNTARSPVELGRYSLAHGRVAGR
jgi:hypothetical protein